ARDLRIRSSGKRPVDTLRTGGLSDRRGPRALRVGRSLREGMERLRNTSPARRRAGGWARVRRPTQRRATGAFRCRVRSRRERPVFPIVLVGTGGMRLGTYARTV